MTGTATAVLFTVEIQAGDDTTGIWQALAPAETVDTTEFFGTDWTAADVAEYAAETQDLPEGGGWRVCVWIGPADDVDTGTDPAHIWTPPAAPSPFGMVTAYNTGVAIRPATLDEHTRSLRAGESGTFRDHDDRVVYVSGGPSTAVDAWEVYRITDESQAAFLGYDDIPKGVVVQRDGEYVAESVDLDEARRTIAAELGLPVELVILTPATSQCNAARWVVA